MSAKYSTELKQTLHDWQNHLNNTFLFLDDGDEIVPIKASVVTLSEEAEQDRNFHEGTAIGGDDVLIIGQCYTDNGIGDSKKLLSELSLSFPKLGMSDNMASGPAQYLYYRARRQFRKSLNENIVGLSKPHAEVGDQFFNNGAIGRRGLRQRGMRDRMISLEALYQLVNNRYDSLENCVVSLLDAECPSRALSRNFGLFATETSKYPVIVYRDMDVGFVDDGPVFYEQYADMVQEFEQFVEEGVNIHE